MFLQEEQVFSSKPQVRNEALKTDPSKMDWNESETGNGLKVDIFINKKQNLVFVHCAEYVPYRYQDCSDWFAFSLDQVGNLTK